MKSMRKSLSMTKVLGSFRKKKNTDDIAGNSSSDSSPVPAVIPASGTTPEVAAHNSVKAFCESGGNVKGDEILFLPPIVDAAESSPPAAAECAQVICKYLSKRFYSRPSWQYNALMLVRILVDNPGLTFTRALDEEFVETTRKLLKHGKDTRVQQMLMETLEDFQNTKTYDDNLTPLVEMWKAEKEDAYKKHGGHPPLPHRPSQHASPMNPHSQNYFARGQRAKQLPDPIELASRLEEARTSANLLEQVVMNTAPSEMLNNELIKEFAERCQGATRSLQGYMQSDNPVPDNETMESLIDTNEQLQTALNQHSRAMLNARKQLGLGESAPAATNGQNRILEWTRSQQELHASGELTPPILPERPRNNGKGKEVATDPVEDPFADPEPRHHYESFHPGFNTTDSYVNRQESAVGKLTMHGAEPEGMGPSRSQVQRDAVEEDDIYDASPKGKEPAHRY